MNGFEDCEQEKEYASGNIYLRPVVLHKKGDSIPGHKHNFDHTTFVTKGSVHVLATCDEGCKKEKDFKAGEHFLVKAEWLHLITALEDETEFTCIYSHCTPQGEIVQEYNGWDEANGIKNDIQRQ